MPASVRAPSSSSPTEAPVSKSIWSSSLLCLTLLANAKGTAFGYPAGVKPLVAIIIPSFINSAASSAVTTFFCNPLFLILISILFYHASLSTDTTMKIKRLFLKIFIKI
ncbi:hypothetical protein ES705_48047 [subsurface metagenome]